MLYVTRLTQNQIDSINAILQCGRVVGKDCCVFSVSGFPYLILCLRQVKVLLLKASINYKKWHSTLQSLRKTKNKNFFIIYTRSIFGYGEIFF